MGMSIATSAAPAETARFRARRRRHRRHRRRPPGRAGIGRGRPRRRPRRRRALLQGRGQVGRHLPDDRRPPLHRPGRLRHRRGRRHPRTARAGLVVHQHGGGEGVPRGGRGGAQADTPPCEDALVFGVPDERYGQRVAAVWSRTPGTDEPYDAVLDEPAATSPATSCRTAPWRSTACRARRRQARLPHGPRALRGPDRRRRGRHVSEPPPARRPSAAPPAAAPRASTHRSSSWDRSGRQRRLHPDRAPARRRRCSRRGPGCVTHIYVRARRPTSSPTTATPSCGAGGTASRHRRSRCRSATSSASPHGRIREYRQLLHRGEPGHRCVTRDERLLPDAVRDERAHHDREPGRPRPRRRAAGMFWFHVEYETLRRAAARRRAALPRAVPPGAPDRRAIGAGEHPAPRRRRTSTAPRTTSRSTPTGAGQMVGLVLEIDNIAGGWYGEGDDMVFVDGDTWPPSIHGTGHEEIFGAGACADCASTPARTPASTWSSTTDFSGLVGDVPLVRRRSDPLHAVDPLDDRARPRQQLRQRLRVGRDVVPGRAARPVPGAPRPRRHASVAARGLRRGPARAC